MVKRISGALCALALVAGAFVALVALPAGAVTVSSESELRTAFGADDSIVLANDITISTCPGSTITRNLASTLVLEGGGFTITQTCAGERVMHQSGTGDLDFRNVNITGGDAGRGILVSGGGLLSLTNSAITAMNSDNGAAISAEHVLLTDSTLSGNHSQDFGGAVNTTEITLVRSTVSGNTSEGRGGGIAAADATLINSTVAGNVANGQFTGGLQGSGGGIYTSDVDLVYSTVVGNTAGNGANIFADEAITSFASVVSGPINSGNCAGGTTTSNGYNFSDDASCNFTGTGDRQSAGSPGLGALAANGGATLTMLPQAGSPLLDGVPAANCQDDGAAGVTTDQRGVTRPQGSGCDIGSVEVEASTPLTPLTPVTPIAASPRFTG
jgi:predicted outer membrane repeat protein